MLGCSRRNVKDLLSRDNKVFLHKLLWAIVAFWMYLKKAIVYESSYQINVVSLESAVLLLSKDEGKFFIGEY